MSEVRAVAGVSLEIYEGECLLIAGANGSGKTLLMRMIAGLLDPTSGEILFKGKPLGTYGSRAAGNELRRAVGLVFQDADAQVVGETVAEDVAFGPKNLGLPKAEVRRRTEEALASLGLSGKRDAPPRRLSGGEKRRLAVAGILAMGGEIIIMDEPFANLDWPGVVHVLEIVTALKAAGKTVIILTHELEKVLALADRLIILARGMIRDAGRPEEVLDRLQDEYGVRDPRKHYAAAGDCTWL
jgi:biotin transport system ATP-binding protein